MMKWKALILFLGFSVLAMIAHAEKQLIEVPVGILEAFAIPDYVSSERYKTAVESSISYALGENDQKLADCGYRIQMVPAYFTKSDPFSIREEVQKLIQKKVWVSIGPIYSNHFLAAVKFLGPNNKSIPMVGLITQSNDVLNLKPPFFTMSPGVHRLAEAAFKAVEKEKYGKRYGVLVSSLCLECKDFVTKFDQVAKQNGYQKFFEYEELTDTPNLEKIEEAIATHTIDFLVTPNYSKMTGYVVLNLHQKFPKLKYVGGDGWGQTVWSFIPGYNLPPDVEGLSARVGMSSAEMESYYRIYSLRRDWRGESLNPPLLGFAMIEFFRDLTNDLCQIKPKDREQFVNYLVNQSPEHFRTKVKIGIFKFKDGQVQFAYEEPK